MKSLFLHDPTVTFLNHGSFGATPRPVFEYLQSKQLELEAEPVQFIFKNGPSMLKEARHALGDFVGCDGDDLVYFPNPTTALNMIIKSLDLNEGDEILTTNHEYGSLDYTWDYYCKQWGASVKRSEISVPVQSKAQFLEELWSNLSPNTKVIFISHISSPTALVFPMQEICDKAKELGIMMIIDGAHAPAQIPLNIASLDPDVYVGACHKWLLAPKGSSFAYVNKRLQPSLDPLVISWGFKKHNADIPMFTNFHEYQGTRDISPFLATTAAIAFNREQDITKTSEVAKGIIRKWYPILCDLAGTKRICSDEFLGQMCSIPLQLPAGHNAVSFQQHLFDQYRIEIPIFEWNGLNLLRVSMACYNTEAELETLAQALRESL